MDDLIRTPGIIAATLTPFTAQRYERIDKDVFQWRHVAVLPELTIDVTPVAG